LAWAAKRKRHALPFIDPHAADCSSLAGMRVLALTPNLYGVSPGQRSSIELWEKVLTPAGIEIDHSPFETKELRRVIYQPGHYAAKTWELARAYGHRLASLRTVRDYDALLVYREAALIGPAFIERLAARSGKPIIYQLDDPLYIPYRSPYSGWFSYLKFFGKVGQIAKLSALVIVNSSFHREYASRFNANVREIPSVVDGDVYKPRPRSGPANGTVTIGWTGSDTTVGNLAVVDQPVRDIIKRHDDVELRVIGATNSPFAGLPVDVRPWRADTEVEDLYGIDIGLLPLPVNEWNKRKFFLKLVQYLALGIPAVCTPLGSNPYVIEHGRTGFLADSTAEWINALECLATDSALRDEMSAAAQEVGQSRYTLQANADAIIDAFKSVHR
jgi:glycosyltransferase involved in cell wall biosynthesis